MLLQLIKELLSKLRTVQFGWPLSYSVAVDLFLSLLWIYWRLIQVFIQENQDLKRRKLELYLT